MNLKKALCKHNVKLSLEAETKNEVIEELIDVLDAAGKLKDRKAALKAVLEREMKMSTGMQNGIAIPHGKSRTVESLVVAIGLKPDGIDFASIDGKPCQVFILTVSPASRTGPHIQFLAEISRLLDNDSVRKELIQATVCGTGHRDSNPDAITLDSAVARGGLHESFGSERVTIKMHPGAPTFFRNRLYPKHSRTASTVSCRI